MWRGCNPVHTRTSPPTPPVIPHPAPPPLPHTAASPEQRLDRRVEFFLVPVDRERLPVWVFKPGASDACHPAGLILNLSPGGVQVLTHEDPAGLPAPLEIQLLLGEDAEVARFHGPVRVVWSRPEGTLGHVLGLAFEDRQSPAEAFLSAYEASADQRRWVRCLLVGPRGTPGSGPMQA